MSNKTRVLHVRVVGFSAPERQMLNSIFLLSVAPARQIGYKLWNPEAGVAPDMYLLDGDSEKQVAIRLGLSLPTVHQYVTALYRKFGVSSRGELLARFISR